YSFAPIGSIRYDPRLKSDELEIPDKFVATDGRSAEVSASSYRDSHKAADKGASYDETYRQTWESLLWSREQHFLSNILDKYFPDQEIRLLDFACGTGRIAEFIEHRVSTSLGVDVSTSMLARAKPKLKRTELIQADLTRGNVLQGRRFNLITAFRFFLNAEPELRLEAIKILSSLLTEDGCLIFNNHHNLGSPYWALANLRARARSGRGGGRVMSIRQMHELARAADLEIVEIHPVGFARLPRVTLPLWLNMRIETAAIRIKRLHSMFESLIAVARHRAPSNCRPSAKASP
ncbi:MAG: class I SAM-dependent methyltransferase, partial [Planctomycetota bacterium]|nr:class I SAM-dependent methyltransferase [Planctomycetota bacterium]